MPTPTNLREYYASQGQALPPVSARAAEAASYGIQGYSGTAEQNAIFLSKKMGGGGTAAPAAEGGGAPMPEAASPGGELGNLRLALREALNEAGRRRVEGNFKALGGLASGAPPGTVGSVVDLIRGGIKPTVEQTFSDIVTGYKDANEAKQKELDRINELRLEYGTAIPSTVKDLQTAIELVQPLVTADRARAIKKMQNDQAVDNDIESWAESFAKGEISIGNVPSGIRTAVKVRADAIRDQLEGEAKTEYKDRISYRVERKVSDWETERNLVLQDDNLNVAEQREVIDYIDGLEASAKAAKASGKKNSSFFGGGGSFRNETTPAFGPNVPRPPVSPFGPTNPSQYNPADALKPFDEAFVQPFRNLYSQPK